MTSRKQETSVFCFWLLVHKTTNTLFFRLWYPQNFFNIQMAGAVTHTIHSFHDNYSEYSPFLFSFTYEIFIVRKEYCLAHDVNKMCFIPICRCRNILIEECENFLQKSESFFLIYQLEDCFLQSGNIGSMERFLTELTIVPQAVRFGQGNWGVDRMPYIGQKGNLLKAYKRHLLPFSDDETSWLIFAKNIDQVKRLNFNYSW